MTVAIVGLLVVDLVLVLLALRPHGDGPVAATSRPSAPAASGTTTSTGTASTTPATDQAPADGAATVLPLSLQLAAVDAEVAWRVSSPSCAGSGGPAGDLREAVVERTLDGGRTWTPVDRPDPVVARLRPTSATEAFVVSAQDAERGCDTVLRSTRDGGSWSGAGGADSAAWFRDPSRASTLHLPTGRTRRPCGAEGVVVDLLVARSSAAAVLCADGRLLETSDEGDSFRRAAAVDGAVAIADGPGNRYLVAATGVQDCAGVALLTVAGDSTETTGCVPATSPPAGRVSVSAVGDTVWMVVGDTTLRSTDGGATLERVTS